MIHYERDAARVSQVLGDWHMRNHCYGFGNSALIAPVGIGSTITSACRYRDQPGSNLKLVFAWTFNAESSQENRFDVCVHVWGCIARGCNTSAGTVAEGCLCGRCTRARGRALWAHRRRGCHRAGGTVDPTMLSVAPGDASRSAPSATSRPQGN